MRGTEGVYRRLITTKNNNKDIKRGAFLRCRLLQTPGEEIAKRRNEMIFFAFFCGGGMLHSIRIIKYGEDPGIIFCLIKSIQINTQTSRTYPSVLSHK